MPQRRSIRNLTSRVYPSPGSLAPWSARAETRSNAREASRGAMRTGVLLVGLALTLSLATFAAAQPLSGPEYIALDTPCRALDTRLTVATAHRGERAHHHPDWRGDHRRGRLWRPPDGGRRRAEFHDHRASRAWAHGRLAERRLSRNVGGEF